MVKLMNLWIIKDPDQGTAASDWELAIKLDINKIMIIMEV